MSGSLQPQEAASVPTENAVLAMLRAKKNAVVVSRLRGHLDYDKAKQLEADLDAAIAAEQVGTSSASEPKDRIVTPIEGEGHD